jgi:hypothetical protein
LGAFAPLQLELIGPIRNRCLVDAKVVGLGGQEHGFIIKFSGLNEPAKGAVDFSLSSSLAVF